MGKNQTLKNRALDSLEGKWGRSMVASLIVFGIIYALYGTLYFTAGEYAANSSLLVLLPLEWGACVFFLRLVRNQSLGFAHLFDGYSVKNLMRVMFTEWLRWLYIALWSLLLVVPGIMKACAYAITDYVLADRPDLSYNAAINESMRLMKGHKMDYFLLQLSFLGWYILVFLTLGIGALWLAPYVNAATAHFYESLKAQDAPAE